MRLVTVVVTVVHRKNGLPKSAGHFRKYLARNNIESGRPRQWATALWRCAGNCRASRRGPRRRTRGRPLGAGPAALARPGAHARAALQRRRRRVVSSATRAASATLARRLDHDGLRKSLCPTIDVQLRRQAFSSRDRGCAYRRVMTARAPSHVVTTRCRRRQRFGDFNGPQTSKQWGPFWGPLQREKPAAETGSRFSQI